MEYGGPAGNISGISRFLGISAVTRKYEALRYKVFARNNHSSYEKAAVLWLKPRRSKDFGSNPEIPEFL
jgi:hypothetical protein